MNSEVIERLEPYLFPVAEGEVAFRKWNDLDVNFTTDYKSIIRKDTNELISVMKDTYQLVPNSEVILPLLDQLSSLDTKWHIDPSHSFVENNRMRLQVTFPDLLFHDGRSDIAMSLFIHNSYDGSEGVRMFWGAIRGICSNGMIFGEVLSKYYARHTSGIQIENLKEQVQSTYDQIPVIKERIDILKRLDVTDTLTNKVEETLGKRIVKYINEQSPAENQWALYNMLTYYISHIVAQRLRAGYQQKVSKLFRL
jgi:hypothetical protein